MEGRLEIARLHRFHLYIGTFGLLRRHDDFVAMVVVLFCFFVVLLLGVVVIVVVVAALAVQMARTQPQRNQEDHREGEIEYDFFHKC